MIKICLAGITGKVGQCLAKAIIAASDLKLTSAVSRKNAGKNIKIVLNHIDADIIISGTVEDALKNNKIDVLIDYTSPGVVKKMC